MPELGAYATEVTLAYVGSALLLCGIVFLSWRQARQSHALLKDAEGRRNGE